MACPLAESPSDPLHRKLRQLRCLRCRFNCYRVERSSSRAGVAPAEASAFHGALLRQPLRRFLWPGLFPWRPVLVGSRPHFPMKDTEELDESVGGEIAATGVDFRVSNSLMSSCQAFEFRLVAKGFSRSA